jgi:hypothetical protein
VSRRRLATRIVVLVVAPVVFGVAAVLADRLITGGALPTTWRGWMREANVFLLLGGLGVLFDRFGQRAVRADPPVRVVPRRPDERPTGNDE